MAKKQAAKVAPKKEVKEKSKPVEEAPAPKPAPKKHERKTKPSEAERLEKGRKLAASYLEQRDGMDPQIAMDVVEGMTADEVNELITEANTAVMDRRAALVTEKPAEDIIPDFVEFEALVADEDFPDLVLLTRNASAIKNAAEKEYKEKKAILFGKLIAAGIKVDGGKVAVMGNILEPYTGESSQLDKTMLLEKGVSIDIINKCYKKTPWNDVRFGKVK